MERTPLEPGLLRIFRVFVGARLVLLSFSLLVKRIWPEQRVLRYPALGIVGSALLLAYLSWPWLRNRLGRAYLPLALAMATAGPIFEQALTVGLRLRNGVPAQSAMADMWQLIVVLFIPLLLISWQYDLRAVIAFCVGTAVLDLLLHLPLVGARQKAFVSLLGLVFVRGLLFAVVGYVVVKLMASQRAQREALARANRQLTHYSTTMEQLATSQERNRLARELHDTLAHTLSAVAVQLEAATSLWEADPIKARSMLRGALDGSRAGLAEARRAIQALRASPLEDLGLALGIRSLAESAAARASLSLELHGFEHLDALDPAIEQEMYRIAEEALLNVGQHAAARHLMVALIQDRGRTLLTISDDGRGFDPRVEASDGHYGLRGMCERAEIIGGILEIDSSPGRGTTVRLTLERDR